MFALPCRHLRAHSASSARASLDANCCRPCESSFLPSGLKLPAMAASLETSINRLNEDCISTETEMQKGEFVDPEMVLDAKTVLEKLD